MKSQISIKFNRNIRMKITNKTILQVWEKMPSHKRLFLMIFKCLFKNKRRITRKDHLRISRRIWILSEIKVRRGTEDLKTLNASQNIIIRISHLYRRRIIL